MICQLLWDKRPNGVTVVEAEMVDQLDTSWTMGGTMECGRATSAGSRYAILSDEGTDSTSPGASETLIQGR